MEAGRDAVQQRRTAFFEKQDDGSFFAVAALVEIGNQAASFERATKGAICSYPVAWEPEITSLIALARCRRCEGKIPCL
jgi:hypothetical protein